MCKNVKMRHIKRISEVSDYDEAQAIRRATRLVQDSAGGMNFSVLNFMMWVALLLVVGAAIASMFK
jgi:hypothetical protein